MRSLPLLVALVALLSACGGTQSEPAEPEPELAPEPQPAPIAQEPAPAPQPPAPAEPTPPPAPPGPTAEQIAAAVQARVAQMPAPPIDGTTQVGTVTAAQAPRICRWMSKVQGRRQETHCPDGSTVTVGSNENDCAAEHFAAYAPCSVSLNEMAACLAGMKAQPCEAGMMGANLTECAPNIRCLQQIVNQRAQQQQPAQP